MVVLRGNCAGAGGPPTPRSRVVARLPYRPPYDWTSLATLLSIESTPGVEAVSGAMYQRTILVRGTPGWLTVSPVVGQHALRLRLFLRDWRGIGDAIERVRGMFDLTANPEQIRSQLSHQPFAADLPRTGVPGLRLPGAWDGFEVARSGPWWPRTLGRWASRRRCSGWWSATESVWTRRSGRRLRRFSPHTAVLARADFVEDGLSAEAGDRLRRLAHAVVDRSICFEPSVGFDVLVARLGQIGGFDLPTSHWIALRSLGAPDAWPIGSRLACGGRIGGDEARLADHEAWRPWQSYVAISILLARLRREAPA